MLHPKISTSDVENQQMNHGYIPNDVDKGDDFMIKYYKIYYKKEAQSRI